ncbi:MAG: aspartate-semialdehyde dehydrogenase [Planctomycetota bacterium]|jgi:aspartate-semialdehyde dehydrogenase
MPTIRKPITSSVASIAIIVKQEMPNIDVALLGATGSVGQRFALELHQHPWFELVSMAASPSKAGQRYGDCVNWMQSEPLPAELADRVLESCRPELPGQIAFSCLDAKIAGDLESSFEKQNWLVVSNTSSHRMNPLVPLVVPEINSDALGLISDRIRDGGAIVTNPNCTTIGLSLALAPLVKTFGVSRAHVVSLQSLSGAGLNGPTAYQSLGNVIPFIDGEEQKLTHETRKVLGDISVSAACNRVPVIDGHTLCVSVELAREATADDLISAWREFKGDPQELRLPSAPTQPTIYLDGDDVPQPRLHAGIEQGMSTIIGRLRPCPHFGWKFVAVSHNTMRGAARGSILLAELCVARGLLPNR